jgi:lysophospholipase L1-like esterase
VQLYGDRVASATGLPARIENFAVGGLDSSGLLRQLQGGLVAAEVARADLVTVTIGANDFGPAQAQYFAGTCGGLDGLDCFRSAMPAMEQNLSASLARIHALVGTRSVGVRVTNYWNVFEDGEVAISLHGDAFVRDSDRLTREVNAEICQIARANGDSCIDIYIAFKAKRSIQDLTALLAPDGDHPSEQGHELIAAQLAIAGYAPLR